MLPTKATVYETGANGLVIEDPVKADERAKMIEVIRKNLCNKQLTAQSRVAQLWRDSLTVIRYNKSQYLLDLLKNDGPSSVLSRRLDDCQR